MIAREWLPFAPAASTLVATIAACVAAWSAATSAKNADRQYASSHSTDIQKWAIDVIDVANRIDDLADERLRTEANLQASLTIGKELRFLIMKGNILFPRMDSAGFSALAKIAREWTKDNKLLRQQAQYSIEARKYEDLIVEFLKEIRVVVGTERRHRFLSGRYP